MPGRWSGVASGLARVARLIEVGYLYLVRHGAGYKMDESRQMLKIIVVPLAFLFSATCLAELKVTEPSIACALLSDSGLKGRKWTDYGDGSFGCASDYKDIGSGSPLSNNLAYYATGTATAVEQVKLVLNFNQPKSKGPAIGALGKASEALAPKVLGAKLNNEIRKAIVKGEPVTSQIGSGSIEVTRDDWPNGKGYEVHVIMK